MAPFGGSGRSTWPLWPGGSTQQTQQSASASAASRTGSYCQQQRPSANSVNDDVSEMFSNAYSRQPMVKPAAEHGQT
jgi:hypothetical protein